MHITVFTADYDNCEAGIINITGKDKFVDWAKSYFQLNEDNEGCPKLRYYWTVDNIVEAVNDYDYLKEIRVLDFDEDFMLSLDFPYNDYWDNKMSEATEEK